MKYLILLILVATVFYVVRLAQQRRAKLDPYAPVILPPGVLPRNDLKFGYFGCMRDQPQRTHAYVNMHSEMFFEGVDTAVANIRYMKTTTHVGLDSFMWATSGGVVTLLPDAEARVRQLVAQLNHEDVLQYVKLISVIDEADNRGLSDETVRQALTLAQNVFNEFHSKPMLYGIYSDKWTWPGVDLLHVVGMDKYGVGTQLFTSGDYERWTNRLHPDQLVMLLPGVADPWRQNVADWINFAHQNRRVYGIMMFAWFTNRVPDADYGKGVEENGLEPAVTASGLKLIGDSTAVSANSA